MNLQDIFSENYISLESICNSILEGVVIADSGKKFLFWNHAAKLILETEPDEVDPVKWSERYHLFDLSGNYLSFDALPMIRALNGEEFRDYRVLAKTPSHPDGIILSVNGRPIRSGQATVAGITTFRDITDVVQSHKLITSERHFYERILDLMPGYVFIKDLKGDYIYGNKSFKEILKTSSVDGKSTKDFLGIEMTEMIKSHDELVLKTGKAHVFEEVIKWDGTSTTFSTIRFPYLDENGEIQGVCVVAREI